jgi:RNA polymerase sigma factor (sigma-70 family)
MAQPRTKAAILYHFCRLRLPRVALAQEAFVRHLERVFEHSRARADSASLQWPEFVEKLHAMDWFLACACVQGLASAWEALFASRASRTDMLLVDALRARAARLFPRDPERQEEVVTDFWGFLLAGQREGTLPILARYDGQRPLVPWLICVFHNKVLSEMRRQRGEVALPDDDLIAVEPTMPEDADARWHDRFREAAHEWFADLTDQEVLLLGLRIRYKLSQREVARLLGIHEGNVTRKIDALSQKCHERIGEALRELGWTGDDLFGFIRKEMASLLLDEPRLAADRLAALLAQRGKSLPAQAVPGDSANQRSEHHRQPLDNPQRDIQARHS